MAQKTMSAPSSPGSARSAEERSMMALHKKWAHRPGAIGHRRPSPRKWCHSGSYQGNPWRVTVTKELKRLVDGLIADGSVSASRSPFQQRRQPADQPDPRLHRQGLLDHHLDPGLRDRARRCGGRGGAA